MMNILLNNSKLNFLLFLLQFLIRINPIKNSCSNGIVITNTDCFNKIIKIENYYRGAQFITNKEGNMIIEYGKDHDNEHEYRLFYGLKKNGRSYFENDNPHREIKIACSLDMKGRYEARNILVYLEEDNAREKQYIS